MAGLIGWTVAPLGFSIVVVVLLAVGAVPLFAARARQMTAVDAARSVGLDLFVVASITVPLVITLWPGDPGETARPNLVPFRDLVNSLDMSTYYMRLAVANLLGNVLLLVPWGAALAFRLVGLRLVGCAVTTAAIAIGIEIWQTGIGRSVDVTDVLMNTLGGAIGFWCARLAIPAAIDDSPAAARRIGR
jgi:glycopeptide antibiotics resistance protein